MAYSKAPETQTYDTQRGPAAFSLHLRPNSLYTGGAALTQDAGMVNLIPVNASVDKKKDDADKRPADQVQSVTRQAITGTRIGASALVNRGCYVWEKTTGTTYYFSVNGTKVHTSTDGITWSEVVTLLTSASTPVRFTEFINDSNVKSLVMVDGVEGYVFTSNAAGTKITDADFPTPHVPFPVFMDGYLFLAKKDTGDIYNSNLNDPAAWTAGDFISSELYPDDIQALVKINNYVLAIGLEGSEYFYDAANATASPLARYEGGSLAFGTLYPNSIACNKRQLVMLCNNNDGEFVLKVIEDFKSKDIDPGFLPQVLESRMRGSSPTTGAALRGFFLRQAGEMLYVLSLNGVETGTPSLMNKTFALSLDTGYWTELRIGSAGQHPYPVFFTSNATSTRSVTHVSGHYLGTPFFGYLAPTATADDVIGTTIPIYIELRTPSVDCGLPNLKTMSRFGVDVTTNQSPTATSGSALTMSVSWTDNDYATFSTPRDLIFAPELNYPFITQLGAFRQRAFKITYNGSYFLQFKSMNFDINKGQQ